MTISQRVSTTFFAHKHRQPRGGRGGSDRSAISPGEMANGASVRHPERVGPSEVIRLPPTIIMQYDNPELGIRKPLVKPQSRANLWSIDEHERFLEGLELYPQGPWKKIAAIVGTKTTRQTMTHAQKYRQKIERRMRETPVKRRRRRKAEVTQGASRECKSPPAQAIGHGDEQSPMTSPQPPPASAAITTAPTFETMSDPMPSMMQSLLGDLLPTTGWAMNIGAVHYDHTPMMTMHPTSMDPHHLHHHHPHPLHPAPYPQGPHEALQSEPAMFGMHGHPTPPGMIVHVMPPPPSRRSELTEFGAAAESMPMQAVIV